MPDHVPRSLRPPGGPLAHRRTASVRVHRRSILAAGAIVIAVVLASRTLLAASEADGGAEPVSAVVLRGATPGSTDTLRFEPPRSANPPPSPLGAGWRHDYDLVLLRAARDLVVYDERGVRRVFSPAEVEDDATVPHHIGRSAGDGRIVARGGERVWKRADTTAVTFHGSLPVRVESPTRGTTTLHHDGDRLIAALGPGGRATRFEYVGRRLVGVRLADGTAFALRAADDRTLSARRHHPSGECPADDREAEEEPCDTETHPPSAAFVDGPSIPGAIRVDARPASCESYFVEHHGTERGTAIERALAHRPRYAGLEPTVANFPVVDFIGAELRVVVSRDLALPTYDAVPDGLFDRLLRDGEDIERDLLAPLARDGHVSASHAGRTTVLEARAGRPVVLELVVRHALASPDQRRQIARAARELLARHGVVLRVVEIP